MRIDCGDDRRREGGMDGQDYVHEGIVGPDCRYVLAWVILPKILRETEGTYERVYVKGNWECNDLES